jgi:D-alanine-D-alanine ligase-like ATP-grasp enzyme
VFKASCDHITKYSREVGFELLGFDFMIDENLKVWLIEVNQNPCLSTLSPKQGQLIETLLEDVLKYASDPNTG